MGNRFERLPMWSPSRPIDLSTWIGGLLDEARVVYPPVSAEDVEAGFGLTHDSRAETAALAYALASQLGVEENLAVLPEGLDYEALRADLLKLARPDRESNPADLKRHLMPPG